MPSGGADSRRLRDDHQENRDYFSEIEEFSPVVNENGVTSPVNWMREDGASLFSGGIVRGSGDDDVYVVVGKQNEEASMDGLVWAIKNAVVSSSCVVFLIHVFPDLCDVKIICEGKEAVELMVSSAVSSPSPSRRGNDWSPTTAQDQQEAANENEMNPKFRTDQETDVDKVACGCFKI